MGSRVYKILDPCPKTGEVMVLIRPVRRPSWWMKDTDSKSMWATIDFSTSDGYVGWSLGRNPGMAMRVKHVNEALIDFASTQVDNGKVIRKWEVRLVPVKFSK